MVSLAGLALIGVPSEAFAVTTIGSNLNDAADASTPCGVSDTCTYSQVDLPVSAAAPGGLVAPSDGVVVRWRIKVGGATGPVVLRVIFRPKAPISQAATGGGTGPTVTPATNQTSTYDVRLPISTGNSIGIDCCAGGGPIGFNLNPGSGTFLAGWRPALVDYETPARSDNFSWSRELLVNADIEPDADLDGYGDETQDLCPTNASIQGACPASAPTTSPTGQRAAALKKCKKKKKSKKARKKCRKKAKRLPV